MITQLVSFDGYTFGSFEDEAGLPLASVQGQFSARSLIVPVTGATSRIVGGQLSERRIDAEIVVDALTDDFTDELDAVLGKLRPESPTPRRLVATRHDGTLVETLATVELRPASDDSIDTLFVTFVAADPLWRSIYSSDLLAPYNPSFATDLTGWASANTTTGVTAAVSRDAAVFHDAAGSQLVHITANTAGAGALTDRVNSTFLPVVAGRSYAFRTAARRDTTSLTPQHYLVWYTAALGLVGFSAAESLTPAINTWAVDWLVATAPPTAAFVQVVERVSIPGAGSTGKVWFDNHKLLHGDAIEPLTGELTVPFTNAGLATVHPIITFIAGPGIDPAGGLGILNRRTFTVTNSGSKGWQNVAIPIDLGDTTGWTWFGTGHTSVKNEFYIFKDGVQVRRTPVNLDTVQSYVWMLVDELPAGATAEYVIAYNGQLADEPPLELTHQYRPAFDISWESETATSGTATTITRTGAGWATSQWRHAFVEIIDGTGEGATIYTVTSSGPDTLTINGTFANGTPNSTSVYLVYMSGILGTDLWHVHDTRQVERSDAERGLWGSSSGQNQPQFVWFDAPGAWSLTNYRDNNDERTQPEVSRIIPPDDYFTIPNISRIWQGGRVYKDGGKFDAVEYKSPFEIISWRFDANWKNPNGMCGALFACREGAGADWEPIDKTAFPNVAASDTHALISAATHVLPDGTYHLMVAVIPRNDEEIPLTWYQDDGTATAGSSTTLTDANQDWEIDQWIGGTARIVGGTGAGGAAGITDSNATSVTVASWPNGTPDATSRYQLTNRRIESNLRAADQFRVIVDASTIDVSAISAEAGNMPVAVSLRLDGGADPVTGVPPYERIDIGLGERKMLLAGGEELRLDMTTRRFTVHDSTSGDVLRTLGGGYVQVIEVRADGSERRSTHSMPLAPGDHTLYAESLNVAAPIEAKLFVEWTPGWMG